MKKTKSAPYATYTKEDIYQLLELEICERGTQRDFAQHFGFSPSYITDILKRRRGLSDAILDTIGVERIVTVEYRKKGTGN